MNARRLELLLVDFDGVMSNGRFYISDDPRESELGKIAREYIFAPTNTELANRWMRGEISYETVHYEVARAKSVDAEQLHELLRKSAKAMPLNQQMLAFVKKLRTKGVKVSLFTNNMDIFDELARSHFKLHEQFDFIYSSSEQGRLKLEDNVLLDRATKDAGATHRATALVDDSQNSYDAALKYGLAPFLYESYERSQPEFEQWLQYSFLW